MIEKPAIPIVSGQPAGPPAAKEIPDVLEKPALDLFFGYHELRTDMKVAELPSGERKKKRTLQTILYPQGFGAGITAGAMLPIAAGLKDKKGQTYGLAAEVMFHGGLRLWADIAYLRFQYSSEKMDPNLGIPPVPPPSDDFVFSDANVRRNSFAYTVGMKQVWNRQGKWQPFLGLGYGVVQMRPYSILYDFEHKTLNVDFPLESEIHQNVFEKDIVHLGAGFEFILMKNLRWKVESYYRRQLGKQAFFHPDYLGLKTGLMYQF